VTILRRRNHNTIYIRTLVHRARRTYLDEIDRQKAVHWKEFLDDVRNIWKANQFTKGLATPVQVPTLSIDGRTAR
jgi:hypothetical protein